MPGLLCVGSLADKNDNLNKGETMKKDELKHIRKGIKDAKRTMSTINGCIDSGQYEAATSFMKAQGVVLQELAGELRDNIRVRDEAAS